MALTATVTVEPLTIQEASLRVGPVLQVLAVSVRGAVDCRSAAAAGCDRTEPQRLTPDTCGRSTRDGQ